MQSDRGGAGLEAAAGGRQTTSPTHRSRRASRASVGGAADAGGVDLQNRVFAWAASFMLAEQPIRTSELPVGIVTRVGAQTGFLVDDVALITSSNNYALFQVKAGLRLGSRETSPFASALEQIVCQYLDGDLPDPSGVNRHIDPERDALVICTNSSASASVRVHLRRAITRIAANPPGTALNHQLTVDEDAALTTMLGHVRRIWTRSAEGTLGRRPPSDEQLRVFLRCVRVLELDLDDRASHQMEAASLLNQVLATTEDTARAWIALVSEAQAAAVARLWRERTDLVGALSRQGLHLSPPARFAEAIQVLQHQSAINESVLERDARLPISGGLHIEREVSELLATAAGEKNILLIGEAGAGKSSVAHDFAMTRSARQDVLLLRASDLVGANRMELSAPMAVILQSWAGPRGFLVVDGVDAMRGAEDRESLTDLVLSLEGSRWQVVATVRTFDARNNRRMQAAFAGPPISSEPGFFDPDMSNLCHLVVGELTERDLQHAALPSDLRSIVTDAAPELRKLLRNPFNLRLAATMCANDSGSGRGSLLRTHSRVNLLQLYWETRAHDVDGLATGLLLTRITREMLRNRRMTVVEQEPLIGPSDAAAVNALLRANVLSCGTATMPAARRTLAFSHNILFDYAVAAYLLYDSADAGGLLRELNADPSLPLVARPSLDLLIELLWESRIAGAFWPTCLSIAESPHTLGSLAFAARLANLIKTPEDVAQLFPEQGRSEGVSGLLPSQELTRQLIGALRTNNLLPDASQAEIPLSSLAVALARNAGSSTADAALCANLLLALQLRCPVAPASPGRPDRGLALRTLLDSCRSDPESMEQIAGVAIRQLPHLVAIDDEARAAAEALLADQPALQQWGGTVLNSMAESVVPAAAGNPDLARRLAVAIVTFHETRDEQVDLGLSAVLPLNEARKQQAEFSCYLLGEAYGDLCTANLDLAASLYCEIANGDYLPEERNYWRNSGSDGVSALRYGPEPRWTPHEIARSAGSALAVALRNADPADAQGPVDCLVADLRNAAAWAHLIADSMGGEQATVPALLPALDSGALLANGRCSSAAATLLAAFAREDPGLGPRLENAILRAWELIDERSGSQAMKDSLLGSLPSELVRAEALAARVAELEEYPEPPDPPAPDDSFGMIVDAEGADEAKPSTPVEAAMQWLRAEVAAARQAPQDGGGTRHLAEAFSEADNLLGESELTINDHELLLAEGAAALARDSGTLPATHIGDRVLAVLLRASQSQHAGEFLK